MEVFKMRTIANIIWFIFAGFWLFIGYTIAAVILCITIIGIPFGIESWKLAKLLVMPFGKIVDTNFIKHPIINLIWLVLFGIWSFISAAFAGIVLCITIVGIPFGLQAFKVAKLTLIPFGATIK